jgi:hypothetical protein
MSKDFPLLGAIPYIEQLAIPPDHPLLVSMSVWKVEFSGFPD